MITDSLFKLLGQSIFIIVVAIIALLIIVLIIGRIQLKNNRLIFPRFILVITDIFYSPLKSLSNWLGFEDTMVDQMSVSLRNHVNKTNFNNTDNSRKILVLPHCLRSSDCQARLDETGLVCDKCGKCSIGVIKEKAESIGYKVFIVPGSSFVKKIIENNDFDSVVGVACYEDLNLTMMKLNQFSPQGVLLSKTGCFETKVDVRSVLEKIGYFDIKKENMESKNPDLEIHHDLCIKKEDIKNSK